MDTDDLTENAYEILRYTHKVNEFLWVEFGNMCRNYKNEDAYLNGLLNYTMAVMNSPDEFSEAWSLDENIKTKHLVKIEAKIRGVLSSIKDGNRFESISNTCAPVNLSEGLSDV